jgi:hypothetical protein
MSMLSNRLRPTPVDVVGEKLARRSGMNIDHGHLRSGSAENSVLRDLRIDQLREIPFEPFMRPLLIRPIRREYPAMSAARMAARRRTAGMARQAIKVHCQIYHETRPEP